MFRWTAPRAARREKKYADSITGAAPVREPDALAEGVHAMESMGIRQESNSVGGLAGQPRPDPKIARRVRSAAVAIVSGSDPGRSRTELFLAFEEAALTVIVDSVADCLGEDTVYRGLASILEEAADEAKDPTNRRFALFNLARLHLERAAVLEDAVRRRQPLALAAQVLGREPSRSRDVAWIDMQGEIESLRGNVAAALTFFERLTPIVGNPAVAAVRMAETYRRAGRLDDGAVAADKGLRSDRDGKRWRHRLYQVRGWIELDRGNVDSAVACLRKSADAEQDRSDPWTFQIGLALALLKRQRFAAVREYAELARKHDPEDPAAKELAAKAGGG